MSDLIDRQIAISAICNACGKIDCDKMDKCEKLQLPPANTSEIPNSSDTISRQAAIDALTEYGNGRAVFISVGEAIIRIEQLPPAQPERIKGRWIAKEKKNLFRCSKCDAVIYSESEYDRNEFYKFCGRCGADMREVTK